MRTLDEHVQRLASLSEATRISTQVAADDRAARDDEIEDADREGVPVRAIARASQLAPGHVSRICAQRTADRQAAS